MTRLARIRALVARIDSGEPMDRIEDEAWVDMVAWLLETVDLATMVLRDVAHRTTFRAESEALALVWLARLEEPE